MARGRQGTAEASVGAEGKKAKSGKAAAEKSGEGVSAGVGGAGQPLIDLDFVRGLIDAVDGSGIDSLEITRAGTRVKISKTPPSAGPAQAMYAPPGGLHLPAPHQQQPGPTSAPDPEATGTPDAAAASDAASAAGLVEVKSPMVGTFYRAPAPDAPPYIENGTSVTKGQTLCILEAMKLMNELECEVDGVVREILVEDTEPVEYGQVLFRIEPSGSK